MAPWRGADERLAVHVSKYKQFLARRKLGEIHGAFSPMRRNGHFRKNCNISVVFKMQNCFIQIFRLHKESSRLNSIIRASVIILIQDHASEHVASLLHCVGSPQLDSFYLEIFTGLLRIVYKSASSECSWMCLMNDSAIAVSGAPQEWRRTTSRLSETIGNWILLLKLIKNSLVNVESFRQHDGLQTDII